MQSLLDPVVLFFLLGALGGVLKSDLRIPESFYNTLSIYLLLSIGIKGGIELYNNDMENIVWPMAGTVLLGMLVTLIAFFILFKSRKFNKVDAVAIATHYGSVSAVTFAVVLSYLDHRTVQYEEYVTVLLVMLEIPAIAVGIFLAKWNRGSKTFNIKALLHEVFLGKTILLLVGGMLIGLVITYTGNKQVHFFFFDLFKGFLAIFMLEMGVVASQRFSDFKKAGVFLFIFALIMPVIGALLGIGMALLTGLSVGGAVVLATMSASASYIAAPAAMRIALPDANLSYCLTASLGITFPFNILFGIPLYFHMAQWMYGL
jgi:uncharacterized protein